jgi:alkylresorcinol/alkylpyrone synthase
MPKIAEIFSALPPYRIGQEEARAFAARLFSGRLAELERLLPLFENTGIATRYFSVPLE